MSTRLFPWVFLSASCAWLACSSNPAGGAPSPPSSSGDDAGVDAAVALTWTPCSTSEWPDGYPLPAKGVECTTVDVPFDHANPADGQTFPLLVARQKSRAFPSGKAVFQIAGGPGGTSVGQSGIIPQLMPKLLDQFDMIYVDQRGTGGSGYLDCSAGYPASTADWIACASEHAKEDLQHYLTVDAAHDLESVRQALGYGKIHVRAGSYGTRLGLEFLRQHASSVAAMVLDGIDPPDATFFQDFIVAEDRGVTALISDCAKDPSCVAITPNLETDLDAYRSKVKSSPRPVSAGGASMTEDETTFLLVLDTALFDAGLYHRVPRAIHAAVSGDFAGWDALMTDVLGETISEPVHAVLREASPLRRSRVPRPSMHGSSYVAPGLYMTVLCAENLASAGSVDSLMALQAQQLWGGNPDMIAIAAACNAWKVTPIDASLLAPVGSDASVLLLNGARDLNTFPEWGAHAAETLSHATNLVVPYATHSTMEIPCVAQVLTDFLEADGDMTHVDVSCIQALAAPTW